MVHHFFREATQLSAKGESPQSCCTSSVSDQPEFPLRTLSLPPGHAGLLGSTDQQALQRRSRLVANSVENMSATQPQLIDMSPTGFYLNSSQQSTGGSSWGPNDLDIMDGSTAPLSIASSEEHQRSTVSRIGLSRVLEA